MKRDNIKISLLRGCLIVFSVIALLLTCLTLNLITIEHPSTGILKSLIYIKIFNSQTQHQSIDIISTSKCENRFRPYNGFLTPNNNANLLEALELFYTSYENAFRPNGKVNLKHGLYRNRISNIFKLFLKQSVASTTNNDLALVDLGIGDFGLYTLVAISLEHQVVAVSSDFCSLEILKRSLENISNSLTGWTPHRQITFLYNAIRQVSCIKIPNESQNCYSGYSSLKSNEDTKLESIRLADIVLSNTFKKFILTVDLQSIEFSILFDDLKNIMVLKYEIPTIILTNWNQVNCTLLSGINNTAAEI
jgi:hypothetical protein